MNHRRVIILETRAPNKREKGLDGSTYLPHRGDIYTVYLRHNQTEENMFDTLVHELLHVAVNIATFKPRMSKKVEESRVRLATVAAINALTNKK